MIHSKVDKHEIVQKFIGDVIEQSRNRAPKMLSKHRLGKSIDPKTKNIWRSGDFCDGEDSDEEWRKRSKSI